MRKLLVLCFLACAVFASCDKESDEPVGIGVDEAAAGVSAVYLERYGLEWRNVQNNSMVVIRTAEELQHCVDGPCESLLSEIDFGSRSLLVFKLYTNQVVYSAGWSYILTTGRPVFSVEAQLTMAQATDTRYIAILVPVLPEDVSVDVKLKIS